MESSLKRALVEAVEAAAEPGDCVALAFSGGLDSALLGMLLAKRARVVAYVAGTPGSHDVKRARWAADILGIPLVEVPLDVEWVAANLHPVSRFVPDPASIPYELPLFRIAQATEEKVIITGQGADEIFAGYYRYLGLDAMSLQRELEADVDRLMRRGFPSEAAMLASLGRELRCPYLHRAVVTAGLTIAPDRKVANGMGKMVLREVAVDLGLPEPIAMAQKKAAQYGSGTIPLLRVMARGRRLTLRDLLHSITLDNDHITIL